MRMESASERAYLEDLIADFGDPECPSVDEALEHLRIRYDQLMWWAEVDGYLVGLEARDWARFVGIQHLQLFGGILSNAGLFRQAIEPDGGAVGFGGPARRRVGEFRYVGTTPSRIEAELRDAFAILQSEPNPVRASILMYQRFVRIHPFYDANGRIGRLLVTFYLVSRGLYPDWALLDTHKGEFLQKLNAVHDHADRPHTRDGYENLLVNFWAKHVRSLADFFGAGEDTPPEDL